MRPLICLVVRVFSRANIDLLGRLSEVFGKTESELHWLANLLLTLQRDQLIKVFMLVMGGLLLRPVECDLDAPDLNEKAHGNLAD